MFITIAAVICGSETWEDIEEYGKTKEEWLKKVLELPNGIPSHDTFNRVYTAIDPLQLEKCFADWIKSIAVESADRIVSIDGKSLQNYLIKTDTYGNTNCSDTFPVPFIISKADTIVQYRAAWAEQQGMIATPVKISNENLLPYEIRDCQLKNPCCNDTAIYANNVICNNTAYTLPDNTTVAQPGIYSNYFQTAKGCDSVIFTSLTQAGMPSIQLGNDTCLIDSGNIILYPKTGYAAFSSFLWQDGSRDSSYVVKKPGLYWVKASSACGTVSDSIMVYNGCNLPIYIPNAFTPNGDRLNDIFKICDMKNQELIDFSIYNRFGQQIFKTNDPKQGWNGKLNAMDQPASTFVYLIRYKDLTGKLQSIKGTVTLLK